MLILLTATYLENDDVVNAEWAIASAAGTMITYVGDGGQYKVTYRLT